MKKRSNHPKVQKALLIILCIVLVGVLGGFLYTNHKQEVANSNELKKAAQEEIQKEKSDQTWTENQKTDDNQNSEDQTNTNQTEENQNNGGNQENAGENSQQ